LAGVGNIGRALIDYEDFKKRGFEIIALFDKDPAKVGTKIKGLKIHHIDDVCRIAKKMKIEIVIIAVPVKSAQEAIDSFIVCGVKAFLNFAPITIIVPDGVMVKNENMSIEMEALSYYLTQNK